MGAYLSEPITEKVSIDEANDKIRCGASSMQGWRESQEDAHNCILDFDNHTSYFAVYDGHGGREVAQYCSQELPAFLKTLEKYKSGDYEEALQEAFLNFDATIATPEIKSTLKKIALNNEGEDDVSDEEENVNNLYEEATMPIEQVIEKYTSNKLKSLKDGEKLPLSPLLKPRKAANTPGTSSAGGSSTSKSTESSTGDVVSSTSSVKIEEITSSDSVGNGNEENTKETPDNVVTSEGNNKPDSSEDMKTPTKEVIENENSNQNGDAVSSSSPENGKIIDKKKGKGKALMKTRGMETTILLRTRQTTRRTVTQLYSTLLQDDSEEDDSEDEKDQTFTYPNVDSSDDENEVQESEISTSEKTSDEDEDDEYDDDDDDDDDGNVGNMLFRGMGEGPGFDSGCTAVVALLKDNELYVANAGDSRCIVCRNGQAIEMSIDHKPEDPPELHRIVKAGGEVTSDGRVNGGLNLSRAIGDHEYKQNKNVSDREQMITALPDIKTLTINSAEDEFMVLACDGIWNFMSSQEVVDFVRPRLQENPDKISQICEEMFDHCLAPDTMGDGTGCDNMTAIIVAFRPNIMKRCASDPDVQSQCKKAKTEGESTATSAETTV